MYPRINDFFSENFGLDIPVPLNTFGLMVGVAIYVATMMSQVEVDRLYAKGLFNSVRAKVRDKKGREKVEQTSPSALIWTMALLAGGFGVVGAKLFHIIDYWDEFVRDPSMLFANAGLTVYGGILVAAVAILWYAHKKGIHKARLADAIAPGLMLAYGIGRIGCYLSGDGDWGVCSSLADKPSWIPAWLWSETFPRAYVGMDPVQYNEVVRGEVCAIASPDGVYPTMLYELAMAAVLAAVLWVARKHPFKAGWVISLYGVLAGLQRFAIE
ncbi:MAG: prolipoprotein diacylglyceryl transferase family protein, partial [Bacteroidota bacterium]